MKFRFSTLAYILFLFSALSLRAQAPDQKFSGSAGDLANQLGTFMTASKRPDLEEAYQVFRKKYQSGAISEGDMQRIGLVANKLAALNLTPFPYFRNYLNAISGAKEQSDTSYFNRWHRLLEQLVQDNEKGKARPVGQFLDFSAGFNTERALKLGEGGTASWKMLGKEFIFEFADGKPRLNCINVTLVGARKQDSCVIKAANGVFFPTEGLWVGSSGQVNWADAGLDSTVYADLPKYQIEVNKPLFVCDSALLHYPLYFNEKTVSGRFEDNIIAETRVNRPYPRFESFEKNLKINKIGEGIEYVGGFRLAGSSLFGYGSRGEPALVQIYNRKRQRIFKGTGELFIFKREISIVAEGVNAKLFMDNDSLFHPAADLRVEIPQEIIHLSRGDKGSERNPFFSSFYNMNLDVEKISWHVNQNSLEIGSRIGIVKGVQQKVEFESSNRFDPALYNRIQHIASQNPLSTLYILSQERGSVIVSDNDFAQKINPKFDYSSIQSLLAQLVAEGFINYYFADHQIELRDKLIHYALASQGKKDYDSIKIESESGEANATLDLKTKETKINEVKKVELSEHQNVAFIPLENSLTLLKNRDMRFSGRLFAGFTLFHGKDMNFVYDKFHIELDSVWKTDFYLPTGQKDKNKQPVANAMNSTIENLSGVLLVDAPNNKSGKEEMDIFPSLQSKKPSYVYYDRKMIQNGVYTRDSFYFKLDPFAFNGLDSYTPEQLRFKGEMFPATIFPSFKETIVVRDHDKSFGFLHRTPPKGYPTYSNKGNYTGEVDLSNKGFLGKGKVEYLTADMESEDVIFRPKQMVCTAKKFFLEEDRVNKVKIPQARGENVSVDWRPYRDSMYVQTKAKAFELFKEPGYTHKGLFILTPSGLKGRGEFDWAEGRLTSRLISYGPFQAVSDTADLQIKSGNAIAFDSRNINGKLDFDERIGQFKANSDSASTTLPLDKLRTSMNEFTWDMRKRIVSFKSDPNKPGQFVSIDPGQDGLSMKGVTAVYDLNTNFLNIGGVEVIKSADAYIYPDSQRVTFKPGGKLSQLANARIVADTVNKYHNITRATVDINGKKEYRATGFYQYDIPGYTQEIFFNNIVGERYGGGTPSTKNVLTTASGIIKEADSFRMDIKTRFHGTAILQANQPLLRFEGFARLDADKLPNRQWFTVRTQIDKNDPTIRIVNAKNLLDDPLVTGFYISRDTGEAYPRILLPAYSRTDRMLIDAEGMFKYDAKNDRFTFGDSLRLLGKTNRGSRMVYENKTGVVEAQGPINLSEGLKYMKVKAAGRLKSNFVKVDTSFYTVTGEIMSGIEMKIPKGLLDVMTGEIRQFFELQPGLYSTQMPFYQPAVTEFVTAEKDLEDVMTNLQNNLVQLPKKDDNFTLLLGKHNVIWNDEYQSFLSTEDRFPLISINGDAVNKVMMMFVEYKMPGDKDDRFYIYLKPSADLWYFFGYQGGIMNVASSSPRFNEVLAGLKTKETQLKMPDGELYEIVAANPSLADAFVSRVRQGRK